MNGDGKPDIAVAAPATNGGWNHVGVLLNTTGVRASTPSFSPEFTFTTAAYPQSITTCDLNADGRPDLAIVNRYPDSLSVLLNATTTGASTPFFSAQATFGTGAFPASITAGDFNSDGKPDLAITNQSDYSAGMFLNKTVAGSTMASFSLQTTLDVAGNPTGVGCGDLNGDGTLDLVVAQPDDVSLSVFSNKTTAGSTKPSFTAQTIGDFVWANSVSIGDLNGDGRPDVAYSTYSRGVLLLNTSRGDFTGGVATLDSPPTNVSLSGTSIAENAAIGNGHLDPGMAILTKPFAMSTLGNKVREMLES